MLYAYNTPINAKKSLLKSLKHKSLRVFKSELGHSFVLIELCERSICVCENRKPASKRKRQTAHASLASTHTSTHTERERDDRVAEQERERKKCSNESMSRSCIYNFCEPSTRAIIQLNGNIRIYNRARHINSESNFRQFYSYDATTTTTMRRV